MNAALLANKNLALIISLKCFIIKAPEELTMTKRQKNGAGHTQNFSIRVRLYLYNLLGYYGQLKYSPKCPLLSLWPDTRATMSKVYLPLLTRADPDD